MAFVDLMTQLESKVDTMKVAEEEMNSAKVEFDQKVAAYGTAVAEVNDIRGQLNTILDTLMPKNAAVRQYS